jgi:hypothetical protein
MELDLDKLEENDPQKYPAANDYNRELVAHTYQLPSLQVH